MCVFLVGYVQVEMNHSNVDFTLFCADSWNLYVP